MAIVNLKSTIYGIVGTAGYAAPAGASRDGQIHYVAGRITNAATDNTGSKYLICELPWTAILQPETAFRTDAWGFAQAVIGVDEDPDSLLDAVKGVSTTGQLPVTIFGTLWNKPLWQALGLASMPLTGPAKLYAIAEANAAGAGTMDFHIRYANHL